MLRITVVDNENIYIEQTTKHIEQYAKEKNRDVRARIFCGGGQLLERYRSQYSTILLDIKVSELGGIDTIREIKKMDQDAVLVPITNMVQYAINGYEVGILDYMLKPLDYYIFSIRLERVVTGVKKRQTEEVLLNLPDGIKRLRAENIHYIEAQDRILHYHTGKGVLTVRGALQGAEGLPWESHFVRCNH